MTFSSDDLVATEGVDESSAASTAEGASSAEELHRPAEQVLGEPRSARPAGETDPAPPDDMESGNSRAARDAAGTGQQLEAGEG